jgi:K+-transporting ATPase c subunit
MKKHPTMNFWIAFVVAVGGCVGFWALDRAVGQRSNLSRQAGATIQRDAGDLAPLSLQSGRPFAMDEYFQPQVVAQNSEVITEASWRTLEPNFVFRFRLCGASGRHAGAVSNSQVGQSATLPVEFQDASGDMTPVSYPTPDPNVPLANAESQLDRVSKQWSANTGCDLAIAHKEIEQILLDDASFPDKWFTDDRTVNVLKVNQDLCKHFGSQP